MSENLVVKVLAATCVTTVLISISHSWRQSTKIKKLSVEKRLLEQRLNAKIEELEDSLGKMLVEKFLLQQDMDHRRFLNRLSEEARILREVADMPCAKPSQE